MVLVWSWCTRLRRLTVQGPESSLLPSGAPNPRKKGGRVDPLPVPRSGPCGPVRGSVGHLCPLPSRLALLAMLGNPDGAIGWSKHLLPLTKTQLSRS